MRWAECLSVLLLATCRNRGNEVCIVHNRHIVHELRPRVGRGDQLLASACSVTVIFSSPVRQPSQAKVVRDVDLRFAYANDCKSG